MNGFAAAVLVGLLTMVSCGLFTEDEESLEKVRQATTAPKLIGRVASINENERFVLIEGYGEWTLGDELLLSSFGGDNERTATLVVSGERMGRYTAADWKSGELEVGDQVFARPLKPVVPEAEEEHWSENLPQT